MLPSLWHHLEETGSKHIPYLITKLLFHHAQIGRYSLLMELVDNGPYPAMTISLYILRSSPNGGETTQNKCDARPAHWWSSHDDIDISDAMYSDGRSTSSPSQRPFCRSLLRVFINFFNLRVFIKE